MALTAGQLIEVLAKFPAETPVEVADGTSGPIDHVDTWPIGVASEYDPRLTVVILQPAVAEGWKLGEVEE